MSKRDYIMQGRNEGIAFCDKIATEDVYKRQWLQRSKCMIARML